MKTYSVILGDLEPGTHDCNFIECDFIEDEEDGLECAMFVAFGDNTGSMPLFTISSDGLGETRLTWPGCTRFTPLYQYSDVTDDWSESEIVAICGGYSTHNRWKRGMWRAICRGEQWQEEQKVVAAFEMGPKIVWWDGKQTHVTSDGRDGIAKYMNGDCVIYNLPKNKFKSGVKYMGDMRYLRESLTMVHGRITDEFEFSSALHMVAWRTGKRLIPLSPSDFPSWG